MEDVNTYVGTEENYQKAMEAAEKAVTLVKYENQTALEGQNLIVAGSLAIRSSAAASLSTAGASFRSASRGAIPPRA